MSQHIKQGTGPPSIADIAAREGEGYAILADPAPAAGRQTLLQSIGVSTQAVNVRAALDALRPTGDYSEAIVKAVVVAVLAAPPPSATREGEALRLLSRVVQAWHLDAPDNAPKLHTTVAMIDAFLAALEAQP